MAKRSVYLILPYLMTTEPVTIRGVTFRNSTDTAEISNEAEGSLRVLFKTFFLHSDLRIREMVYAILEYDDENDASFNRIHRQWSESCLLIEYLYSHPHASWRAMRPCIENAAMYLFQPWPISASYHASNEFAESIGETPGSDGSESLPDFSGTLLRRRDVRFTVVKGARIYPPDHFIYLNIIHKDLSHAVADILLDKTKWALAHLLENQTKELTEAERRCLYAMRWFSDSCRSTAFEDQSLLLQAVAFETLLNIDPGNKEKVTERFRATIKTIVGGFPRIDSWTEQFYNARSRVVHEGGLPDSVYYAIVSVRDNQPSASGRSVVNLPVRQVQGLLARAEVLIQSTRRLFPLSLAMSSGVWPSSSRVARSAPLSTSTASVVAAVFLSAAKCAAVRPPGPRALTSAPCAINQETVL
jgi:hypothetical protein